MNARNAGFSAVELMAVLMISSILMALALPGFRNLTLNTRRTVVVDELLGALSLAREEALKRGSTVTVCALDATGALCGGGTDWHYGWVVFVDTNGNGQWDAGEPAPLKRWDAEDPGARSIRAVVDAGAGAVLLQPFNQAGTTATLTVCDARGAPEARAVSVSATGRALSSTTDAAGAALTCP